MVALQKAVDGNSYGNMKGYYPERSIPTSGLPSRPNPGVSIRTQCDDSTVKLKNSRSVSGLKIYLITI